MRKEVVKASAGKEEKMKQVTVYLLTGLFLLAFAGLGMTAEAAGAASGGITRGVIALGAGLAIGLAAFGCGLAQGRVGGAAMESIGRNPNSADKIFTPLILSLALIEALGIYALIIALTLANQV